ncbi:exosortase family protein XrtG [Clostridium cavendishii DSM 21758]|uniref:Exosortase family protein XrtG n=1 Tax=Clostridium cavendishii DSM 21758 TaxID=1121302 RepID=A0A1M6JAZ4_9CLOT|nr:exosortase family protein XrtG [Clostridium cavendishii]SHJ43840.1 exosortase family protein XrtG [Clostridium cavendishii DSM 21758]
MNNQILCIIITLIWGLILLCLNKNKMHFLKFLVGSLGLFTISMIFFMTPLEGKLIDAISYILKIIADKTSYFNVYEQFSIIVIEAKSGIISMAINYECSGIIELMVFTALCLFFPFGSLLRKVISLILGNVFLFGANIIRLMFIIVVVKIFGASSFYLAHTIFARIIFFGLTILLYYIVFTSTQLKLQKVGDMSE